MNSINLLTYTATIEALRITLSLDVIDEAVDQRESGYVVFEICYTKSSFQQSHYNSID